MRELAISQEIVRQVAEVVAEHGADRATRVVVEIGPLSGVEERVLRAAFPLAAYGSVAEDAELEVEQGGIVLRCESCGTERETYSHKLQCPACGAAHTTLVSGRDVILVSVDMAEEEDEEEDEEGGEEEDGEEAGEEDGENPFGL